MPAALFRNHGPQATDGHSLRRQRPPKLANFDPDIDFDPEDIAHVAELFHTPLDGSYNWDYRVADNRIKRLHELGKEPHWNASTVIDWHQNPDYGDQPPLPPDAADELIEGYPGTGYRPFDELATRDKLRFIRHDFTWPLSQFLPGEQGALPVASQLASCAPSSDAKLYAALSAEERDAHAEFAYQACIGTRDPLIGNDVFRYFGWDVEHARGALVERGFNADFLNMLHARIIPNLKPIGLRTDGVRPKFEEMGLLDFENLATDGDIDRRALERPLDVSSTSDVP